MTEIGNLAVRLSLDNAQFERSVKSMNTTLKAMGQEIRTLQNKGKDWGASLEGLRSKQDAYGRLLEGQQTKVRKLAEAYEKAKVEQGEHADKTQRLAEQYNRATAEMTRTETELNAITAELRRQEAELAKSQSSWNKFGEAAKQAGDKLKAVGNKMKDIGRNMSMYVTTPLAAMGAGIVKIGMDFDSQMSKVSAVSGATGADFDKLRGQAQELGKTTVYTATQAAEGMEYLALAGFKTNDIMSAMPGMLNLAAAAGMNLGTAADITSDVMSAFGMSANQAGHAADVFAYAQANANTNVEQAGEAMKYLAPVANQMGWSIEQSAAAIMKLADNGLKGSIAGQAFASSLGRLAKPTRAMKNTMEDLGISFFDVQGNMKSLPDIVANLESSFDGLTMQQRSAALTTLFGAEAYKHWAILLESGSGTLAQYTKELENSDGTAKRMADTMMDNLAGSLNQLKAAFEGLAIQFSDLIKGDLRAFADWITKMAAKFGELSDSTKKTILVVASLVAAIGPLLVVGGMLISSLGTIFGAFGTVSSAIAVATTGATAATPAIGALASVFTALTGPIGLTVAALGGLSIGAIAFAKNMSESALPSIERFGKGVSESTKEALNGFFDLSENASQSVTNMYVSSTKVTAEMANQLTAQFDQMNTQIVEGMKKRNAEQISDLQKFFMDSSALSSEEEEKIIADTKKRNEYKIQEQNEMNEIVKGITQKAAEEKRELTERENEVINNVNRLMKENAIRTFSESELEQKVILERMKENASIISAEQAAEVIKNAVKQKDEVIKEANETYEKRIAQIIQMRDETGAISAEQADRMIAEATKAKDQTIKLAEDQHQKIVEKAKQQADEHVDKVNWETGEILSKWEQFKSKHADIFKSVEETYKKVTDSLKEVTSTAYDFIKKTIDEKLGFVVKFAQEQLEKMKKFWDENGQQILGLVKLYFGNIKSDIQMVMGIIKGIFEMVWPAISGIVKVAWNTIKLTIGTATDLVLGIIQTVLKLIQGDWKGAWESVKKTVEQIWRNIEGFFKSVNLVQIGKDIINGLIEGIGSMTKAVKKKVEELASKIPQWAKDLLGIKSPSRVFKEIGAWVSEGWAIGIEEKGSMVKDAVSDIALTAQDIAEHYLNEEKKLRNGANSEIAKIEKNKATEIAKIEKRMHEDVAKAQRAAASKKKKTTQDDALKIQRIKEDAAAKILKLETSSDEKIKSLKSKSTKEIVELETKMNKDLLEETKRYIDDKKSLDQLSLIEEAQVWEQSMKLFAEGTKERVKAQQEYKKATEAVSKEITAINTDFQNQIQKINDDLVKQEETLTKAYEDAVDKRASSLVSFKSLFDAFKVEIDVTGEQLIANLHSQVDGFKLWQSEIEKISGRAIDKGLIEELRQMGPNALPQLVALNQLTDSQLQQYSDLYKEKSKLARKQAEAELKGMKEDTDKQIKELRTVANKQLDTLEKEWNNKIQALTKNTSSELSSLKQIGVDAGNGLLQGLSSTASSIQKKAQEIADSVNKTISKALQIKSPSRVMKGFGVNIGEGLVIGMDDMLNKVTNAAGRLASSVEGSMSFTADTNSLNRATSITTNNTNNTPINITLHYNGTGSERDAFNIVDIVEKELGSRFKNNLRLQGSKG